MMPGLVFAWPDGDRAMGTTVSIRVDDQPVHTGIEWITGKAAQALVSELEHGATAVTRHVAADTGQALDASADLAGIDIAIAACVSALASGEP